MKIALTGGGGFLGRAVCREWIERGVAPDQLLVVSRSRHPLLDGLGVRHHAASVVDHDALRAAFTGVDVVYHLAGIVSRDPRDAARLHAVHVEGTRSVLAVARECDVRRVVVASSTGTFGCTRDPTAPPHEDGPDCRALVGQWPYYATKIEAESIAMAAHHDHGQSVIILNPSLLLGPGDVDGSSTTDVADFLAGTIPAIARGGVNFVDVRDAAMAFVEAAERGVPGARHLLGAENLTIRSLLERLERISDRRGPRMSPPGWIQVALSKLADGGARLIGRRGAIDPATAAMGQLYWYAQGERALHELGFRPRPADDTLGDTVHSLTRHG